MKPLRLHPIPLTLLALSFLLASPAAGATTAEDDIQLTAAATATNIEVLANDTDSEGDPLSTQSPTQGANGAVVLNGDNTLTYTPNGGHLGRDNFTYTASDGSDTDTATVRIVTNDTFDPELARDDILAGVTTLTNPVGAGSMVVWGPTAYVISNYSGADRSDPLIAAATLGSGRVIAIPDSSWLNMDVYGGDSDMANLYENGIAWLSGTTSKTTIKIVVYRRSNTVTWLTAQGYTNVVNVTDATIAAELATAEVLVGYLRTAPPQATLDEISDFLLAGGGLFVADSAHGHSSDTPDIPSNRILREAGLAFAKDQGHSGDHPINRAAGQVIADDVIAILDNPGAFTNAQKNEAAGITRFLFQALPAQDLLRARLEVSFAALVTGITPTPLAPVGNNFEQALLVAESELLLDLAIADMTPHRAALPVNPAAPRINTFVTVDAPPAGHSKLQIDTGLYVPPGEIVTVDFPAALVGIGLRIQVGHLRTDLNDNEFLVMPNQQFFFDVDAASIQVASPHGGLLILEANSGVEWTGAQNVQVNGAVEIPYFTLGQTTNAQWNAGIRDRGTPFGVLKSDKVVLVIESEQWLRTLADPEEVMDIWRELIRIIADFYDYDRGRPLRIHHDYQPAGGVSTFPLSYTTEKILVDFRYLTVRGEGLSMHEHGHHADHSNIFFDQFGEASPNLGGKYTQNVYKNFSWKQELAVGRINNYEFSLTDDLYNHFNHYRVDVKVTFVDSLANVFGWPAIKNIVHTLSAMPALTNQEKQDQWLIQTSLEVGFDVNAFLQQWQLDLTPAALTAVAHLPQWNMVETVPESLVTPQDTPILFPDPTLNDFSYDGGLTLTYLSVPANGIIVDNGNGTYTYLPDPGFTGKDPIQYYVANATGNVFTGTIDITVTTPANFPTFESGDTLAATDTWTVVNLDQTFTSPVVIAQPVSAAATAPLVTRIRNAGTNSFELRVQRADALAGVISNVPVHYIVAESGTYNLATHGVKMEAGTVSSPVTDSAGNFTGQHLALAHEWEDHYFIPTIFGQVMSYQDTQWSTFWAQATLDSYTIGKHVGEDPITTRANETLGYIVMEAGSLQIGEHWFQAGDTDIDGYAGLEELSSAGNTLDLQRAPNLDSALIQPYFDDVPEASEEGAWAVLTGPAPLAAAAFSAHLIEDQFQDAEQVHDDLKASYIAVAGMPLSHTVTNTNDSGPGSLREFIATVAPGSNISFASTLSGGTIDLTSGELAITQNLAIDASTLPSGITIDANGASRVFDIDPGITAILHSLTVTGGSAAGGGGIHNQGTLTLVNSTVENNITSSGQGGGIRSNGILIVSGCTIANNTSASNGGGIHSGGASAEATITNTTFSGNTSSANGGGAFNNTTDATATLTHVTVTGNTAAGGGPVGGVRRASGTVTVNNSIVAANTATGAGNPNLNAAVIQTGANLTSGDPLLTPLGSYGGPTDTMPPLPDSPAINAAATGLTTDQRGVARPVAGDFDIGAVEAFFLVAPPFVDIDNDGINDLFEGPDGPYTHLMVGTDDSSIDTDGDGDTDAEEILNGTRLFDATSSFRITGIIPLGDDGMGNPLFEITWITFPGFDYFLECDADLLFSGGVLLGPVTAQGPTHTETVTLHPAGRDYVRVRRDLPTVVTDAEPQLTINNSLYAPTGNPDGLAGIVDSVTAPDSGTLRIFNTTGNPFTANPMNTTNDGPGWVSGGAIGDPGVGLTTLAVGDLYLEDISGADLTSYQWEWTISAAPGEVLTGIVFRGFASGNQFDNGTMGQEDEGLDFQIFLNGSPSTVIEVEGDDLDNWFAGRNAGNINLVHPGGPGVTTATVRMTFDNLQLNGSEEAVLVNAKLTAYSSAP